jgi:predicted aconitase
MAATGAVALYHVEDITPEAQKTRYRIRDLEKIPVELREIANIFREVPVEAVALGCPHCSPEELGTLARLLAGKRVRKPLYIFASQGVIDANRKFVETIGKSGAKVYADTCMVVSPVMEQYKGIMVNSGKALAYVPDMCGGVARIGTTEECVKVAME